MKRTFVNLVAGLAAGTFCAGAMLASAQMSRADDAPYYMAPPISTTVSTPPSAGSVFNFSEVPEGQQVPIQRAVFDQGGYQLFDTVGETIVVPFTNNNLYVMKFAVSSNGETYFINDNGVPTLYMPRGAYLENATVAGARWYPFNENFHPADPVYVGCAPSWSVFVGMAWYPGMCCYGGYWGERSFIAGGYFTPSFGLFFDIGGNDYWGWNGYRDYWHRHPGYDRIGFYNRGAYGSHGGGGRVFGGSGGYRAFGGDGRTFRGGHEFWAHRSFNGASSSHSFSGGNRSFGDSGHSFGGESHSFGDGGHSFGDRGGGGAHFGGGGRNGGGGRSGR